jgi:hypothetical protein
MYNTVFAVFVATLCVTQAAAEVVLIERSFVLDVVTDAQILGGSPPALPPTDPDSQSVTKTGLQNISDDVLAGSAVTNGPGGGTDLAQSRAEAGLIAKSGTSGLIVCGESHVFSHIESNGPGTPATIFSTGEANTEVEYVFQVTETTNYNLRGHVGSFPEIDVNDAAIRLIGPDGPAVVFQQTVSGTDVALISNSGSLQPGEYHFLAEAFSTLSGRGGIFPDTAEAEFEMLLSFGPALSSLDCTEVGGSDFIPSILQLLLGT